MKTPLVRFVALFLLPCLIFDPGVASVIAAGPPRASANTIHPRIDCEALALPDVYVRNAPEKMAFVLRRSRGQLPLAFDEDATRQTLLNQVAFEIIQPFSIYGAIGPARELVRHYLEDGGDLRQTAQAFVDLFKKASPGMHDKTRAIERALLCGQQIVKHRYLAPAKSTLNVLQGFLEDPSAQAHFERHALALSAYDARPDKDETLQKARQVLQETSDRYHQEGSRTPAVPDSLEIEVKPLKPIPRRTPNPTLEPLLQSLQSEDENKRLYALGELKLAYLLNRDAFMEATAEGEELGSYKTQIVKTLSGVKATYLGGDGIYNGGILIEDNGTRILIDFGADMERSTERYDQVYMRDRFASGYGFLDKWTNGLLVRLKGLFRFDGTPDSMRDINQKSPIDAFFLSHGHADHFWNQSTMRADIPKYMSAPTAAMLRTDDHSGADMTKELFSYRDRKTDREIRQNIHVFEYGKPIRIGTISVTTFPVDHSAVGSVGFLIETSAGVIAYSGDLRMNWDKGEQENTFVSYKRWTETFIEKLAQSTPLAFFSESTNLDKEYSRQTEMEVQSAMGAMLDRAQRRRQLAVVNYNWKNEWRMESILAEAKKRNMKFAVSPKVAYFLEQLKEQELRETLRYPFAPLYDLATQWDIDLRDVELRPGAERQDLTDVLFAGQLLKWPPELLRGLMQDLISHPGSVDISALEAALGYKKGKLPNNPAWDKLSAFFDPHSENEHDWKAREFDNEADDLELTAVELDQSGRSGRRAAVNQEYAERARNMARHERRLADVQREQAARVRAQIFLWLPSLFANDRSQLHITRLRAILNRASQQYLAPSVRRTFRKGIQWTFRWEPPDYEAGLMEAEVMEADKSLRQSYRLLMDMDAAGRKTGLLRLQKHLESFRLADYGFPDLWKEPNLLVFKTQKKSGEYQHEDYRRFEQRLFKDSRFKEHELRKAQAVDLKNDGVLVIALGSNEIQDIRGIVGPREPIQAKFSQGKPFSPGLEIDFAAFSQWIKDQAIPGEPVSSVLSTDHASGHLFKEQLAAMIKKVDAAYTFFIHGLDREAAARQLGQELNRNRKTVVPLYRKEYEYLTNDAHFMTLPPDKEAMLSDQQLEFMRRFTRSELDDLFSNLDRVDTHIESAIASRLEVLKMNARVQTEPLTPDSTDREDRQDKMAELRRIFMAQRLRLDLQRKIGTVPADRLDQAEKELTNTIFTIVYRLALEDMVLDLAVPGKQASESRQIARALDAAFREHAHFSFEPEFRLALDPQIENAYDSIILDLARRMITQSLHDFFAETQSPLANRFPVLSPVQNDSPQQLKDVVIPLTPPRTATPLGSQTEDSFRQDIQICLAALPRLDAQAHLKELFEENPVWFMKYTEGGHLLGASKAAILPEVQGGVLFHGRVNQIAGTTAEIRDGDFSLMVDNGPARRGPEELFSFWGWWRVMQAIQGAVQKMLLIWGPKLFRKDLWKPEATFPFPVVRNQEGKVLAVLITHAHLDHMWSLYALDPDVLVIMSEETRAMLEVLQDENDNLRSEFTWIKDRTDVRHKPLPRIPRNILTYRVGATIDIPGTPFNIRGIRVGHSVPADAFIIETSMGKVVYTGDLTYQGPEDAATIEFFELLKKEKDILWLMTEGSNVRPEARDNEPSRETYAAKAHRAIELAKDKPVFPSFKYYVHALRYYYAESKAVNRRLVVPARLIKFATKLRDLGYDVPDLLNDPEVLLHIPKRSNVSTAMRNFIMELTGHYGEQAIDPADSVHGLIPAERCVSSEQLKEMIRRERLLVVLGQAQLNEWDTIQPPADSVFIYSLGALFNDPMKSLHAKDALWTRKFQMTWEDIYVSPHIDEALLMRLLSTVHPKYLVPVHTHYPERFQAFLPDRRILIPRMLHEYPLLRHETFFNLVERVVSGRSIRDAPAVSSSTDAEMLMLLQTLTSPKTSQDYHRELQAVVHDLRALAVTNDMTEYGDALRQYYSAQQLRLELRRNEHIGSESEWATESEALDQALLTTIDSIARSMNTELTDLHAVPRWTHGQLTYHADHNLESDDNGPSNEVKLARLSAELLYQATRETGIDPALPYAEKTALASQLFGPIEPYRPMSVADDSTNLAQTNEPTQIKKTGATEPLDSSPNQTLFVPIFPDAPEWIRQPLMDALRAGGPHVTVMFENLSDQDLALFKAVASGQVSPSTRTGHFKIEGHLELYKDRIRHPAMYRIFLSTIYAVHSLGVKIDVESTPETKFSPLDTSNPRYREQWRTTLTEFALGHLQGSTSGFRALIDLYKGFLTDKTQLADLKRANWRKGHSGTLVVVREALQSGLVAKWKQGGSGEPVLVIPPGPHWNGWEFSPLEALARREWLSQQVVPEQSPQGWLNFGDADRPTRPAWEHLSSPDETGNMDGRLLLQGIVAEILKHAYIPNREPRPGQTLRRIVSRLSYRDLTEISSSLSGLQMPKRGAAEELVLGKVLDWLVAHQKIQAEERRCFPYMNYFLTMAEQNKGSAVPAGVAVGAFIVMLPPNRITLVLGTLLIAGGFGYAIWRRWRSRHPKAYDPDTLFNQPLTQPVKIYLALDTLTSMVQYMEMVVLPWYIARVTGNAWAVGIAIFSYQLLYSLAPITGSVSDMYQKKNWSMFRSLLFIRMIPISILGVLTFYSGVTDHVSIPVIAIILLFNGLIQSWLGPLFSKILKEIAISSGMDEAPVSFRSFLQGMARALGPGMAWILFNTFIRIDRPNLSAYAYWLSAAAFGLMGLATLVPRLLPVPEAYRTSGEATSASPSLPFGENVIKKAREAFGGIWKVITKAPVLSLVSLGFILPYKVTAAAALVVIAPLLPIVRSGGGAVLALLATSGSLGNALVSYVNSRFRYYPIHQGKLLLVASFASGVFFGILAWHPGLPPLAWYGILLVEGFCVTLLWEIYFRLAFAMKGQYIGRANGLLYQSIYGGAALGSLTTPLAVEMSSTITAFRILSTTWLAIPALWFLARVLSPRIRNLFELKLPDEFLPASTLEATMLQDLKNPRSPLRAFRRKANKIMREVVQDGSLVVIATHNLKGLPPDADAQTYEAVVYARVTREAQRQNRRLVVLDQLPAAPPTSNYSDTLHVLFLPIGDDNEGFTPEERRHLSGWTAKKALYVGDIRLNPNAYGPDSHVGFNWIDVEDHHEWPDWMIERIDRWNSRPDYNIVHTPSLYKSNKGARFFSAGHLATWMLRDDDVYWKKSWTPWDFFTLLSIFGDGNQSIFPEFSQAKALSQDLLDRYQDAARRLTLYGMLVESSDRPAAVRDRLRQDLAVALAAMPRSNPYETIKVLQRFLTDPRRPLSAEMAAVDQEIVRESHHMLTKLQDVNTPVVFQANASSYAIAYSVHRLTSILLNIHHSWNGRNLVHFQLFFDQGRPERVRILAAHDPEALEPNLGKVFLETLTTVPIGGGHWDRAGGTVLWKDLAITPYDRLGTTEDLAEGLIEKYAAAMAPYKDLLTHDDEKRLAALLDWLNGKLSGQAYRPVGDRALLPSA